MAEPPTSLNPTLRQPKHPSTGQDARFWSAAKRERRSPRRGPACVGLRVDSRELEDPREDHSTEEDDTRRKDTDGAAATKKAAPRDGLAGPSVETSGGREEGQEGLTEGRLQPMRTSYHGV